MYVCMCACVYVCMCIYACMCACVYHACKYAGMKVCVYACLHSVSVGVTKVFMGKSLSRIRCHPACGPVRRLRRAVRDPTSANMCQNRVTPCERVSPRKMLGRWLDPFQACFGINVDMPVNGSDCFEHEARLRHLIGSLRTDR